MIQALEGADGRLLEVTIMSVVVTKNRHSTDRRIVEERGLYCDSCAKGCPSFHMNVLRKTVLFELDWFDDECI